MVPRVLKQRSSWPSSFATSLIGWNALALIVALALGYTGSLGNLFAIASVMAVVQVIALRLASFPLHLDRGVWRGAVWGGVTAAVLIAAALAFVDLIREYPKISFFTAIYAGMPVGAFLSYFHRDDRRIEAEAREKGRPVDYGRDAHWLDPFLYGAVCYLVAFVPRSIGLAVGAAVVGSFVGVVAAGVSHFFLSRWKNAIWTVPLAGLAGAALGAVTGLLFRNYSSLLLWPPLATGAAAGALTFVATAAVGRVLARRERAAESLQGQG